MGTVVSNLCGRDELDHTLLSGSGSDFEDEEFDVAGKISYVASFDELEESHVQYDSIIWILISLLLVLAWGIGLILLLYLPYRRYILRKDIHSRKLYVTSEEIVYKVVRPSFFPFLGVTKIEKHIFLPLVIDIIIEQGCLQSIYGIHTLRVENAGQGTTAPVDQLQVQGVTNPGHLRKVIMAEAARSILGFGRSGKPSTSEVENILARSGYVNESTSLGRPVVSPMKLTSSPWHMSHDPLRSFDNVLMMNKLEEIEQTVKKIEYALEGTQRKGEIGCCSRQASLQEDAARA